MKLTWFGGTTLRIHIGGDVLVANPAIHAGVEERELVSGADRVFAVSDDLPAVDPATWRPRRPAPLLEPGGTAVLLHRLGGNSVLVDALGEPPLVLLGGPLDVRARWTGEAVVVIFDRAAAEAARRFLGPRLLAVAADPAEVEAVFAAVAGDLAGTSLVALEPGMALEA